MSSKYNSSFMSNYLYNKLPQVYRNYDNQELLKRFIEVMSEGGYINVLNDTHNIMDLLDVDKCPSKFLPLLCSYYGYEYNLEIPELFQRRLLKYIVDVYKRKGTKSSIKFIARELTGFESDIIENKDFDEEQIRITKWDKRFEHYRNFILRLTAPYENSQLYNKEDIVIKIINNFLPTNSQVLVITVYWFLDEKDVVNNVVENVFDIVRDYNNEVFSKTTVGESEAFNKIKDTLYSFDWSEVGEEESTLNMPPIGIPLFTNVVQCLVDTVKFNVESYEKFLRLSSTNETSKLKLSEATEGLVINNAYSNSDRLKDILHSETKSSYGDYTFSFRVKEQVFLESQTVNKNGLVLDTTKIKETLETLLYLISGINETNCDIIKIKSDVENSDLLYTPCSNSFLNSTPNLYTNGLYMFDIIKEKGKEDVLIIL